MYSSKTVYTFTLANTNRISFHPTSIFPPVNGYCMAPGDCICNEGYNGTLCQIDNDVCGHQQPCQNDGTCSNDGPDDYTCNCPTGITGADCEQDINECSNNRCENGATCMVSYMKPINL